MQCFENLRQADETLPSVANGFVVELAAPNGFRPSISQAVRWFRAMGMKVATDAERPEAGLRT